MSKPFSRAARDLAVALYRANATAAEILGAVGCSKSIVRNWSKAAGFSPKAATGGDYTRDPVAIRNALKAYQAATGVGAIVADVAREPVADEPLKPLRKYICPPECACLLCQLGDPEWSRRTPAFAIRLDL